MRPPPLPPSPPPSSIAPPPPPVSASSAPPRLLLPPSASPSSTTTAALRPQAAFSPSHRLNAWRSAMTNSLVRIGTVEGQWVKRALTALIRPSSHQQGRRAVFQPRPSRLSVMSKADDL